MCETRVRNKPLSDGLLYPVADTTIGHRPFLLGRYHVESVDLAECCCDLVERCRPITALCGARLSAPSPASPPMAINLTPGPAKSWTSDCRCEVAPEF